MKKENLFHTIPSGELKPESFAGLASRLREWTQGGHKCVLVMSEEGGPCLASFMIERHEVIVLQEHELSERILYHIFLHNRPLYFIKSYLSADQTIEDLRRCHKRQNQKADSGWDAYCIYKSFGPVLAVHDYSELHWWPGPE